MKIKKLKIIDKENLSLIVDNELINVFYDINNHDFTFYKNDDEINFNDDEIVEILLYIKKNINIKEYNKIYYDDVFEYFFKNYNKYELYESIMKDKESTKTILTNMLNFYIKNEEYEKCAVIQKSLNYVNTKKQL